MKEIGYWTIQTSETLDTELESYLNWVIGKKKLYRPFILNGHGNTFIDSFVTRTVMFHITNDLNAYLSEEYEVVYEVRNNRKGTFSKEIGEPELTIITYITNPSFCSNDCLHVFTEINLSDYKYKKFELQENIFFYSPQKNTQLTYDGNCFSGFTGTDAKSDGYHIVINVYPKKVDCLEPARFKHDIPTSDIYSFTIVACPEYITQIPDEKMFSWSFFNNLLYNQDNVTVEKMLGEVKPDVGKCLRLTKVSVGDVSDKLVLSERKVRGFEIRHVIPPYVLQWIMNDVKKEKTDIENNGEIIHLQDRPSIFHFLLFLFNSEILPKLAEYYKSGHKTRLNITNILFLKFEDLHKVKAKEREFYYNVIIDLIPKEKNTDILFEEDGAVLSSNGGDAILYACDLHRITDIKKMLEYVIIITIEAD